MVGPFGVNSYPVFGPGRSVYSGRRNRSSKSGVFSGTSLLTCNECKQRAVCLSTAETNSHSSFPIPNLPAARQLMHPGSPASTPPSPATPALSPCQDLPPPLHTPTEKSSSPYPHCAGGKPFALPRLASPWHCLVLGSHVRRATQALTIYHHTRFSKAVIINPVVVPHASTRCHPQCHHFAHAHDIYIQTTCWASQATISIFST